MTIASERLYLAYITGLTQLGLEARATLGIPGGERRLDRILALIEGCRYSIHDLSRVQLDRTPPSTPRFNMPFELGLTVALARADMAGHLWFVFESKERRIQKSLSDLNGSDVYIHEGTVEGVMRQLCNAFVRRGEQPTVVEMVKTYRLVSRQAGVIAARARARSIFEARVFADLSFAAQTAVKLQRRELIL